MPDLLLELFSEEIPARMQARAAEDLKRLVTDALVERGLTYEGAKAFATPRRLALVVGGLPARQPDRSEERKGPRVGAPEKALEGFLKAAGLASIDEAVVQPDPKGDFYVARIEKPGREATEVIAEIVPAVIRNFPWPKSMRWGSGSLRWVRPLHAIVATFGVPQEDPEIIRFEVDGIASGDVTFGHRVHAPEPIRVRRFEDYEAALTKAHVVLDPERRRDVIRADANTLAQAQNLELVEDEGLVEEVSGLVEWPVVLMGAFDEEFLEVPDEVIRATIRANQKCFVLRRPEDAGKPAAGGGRVGMGFGSLTKQRAASPDPVAGPAAAPKAGRLANRFILVSNLEASDGGAAIVAGNERVVRARLADARFFWETDRKVRLEDRLEKLKSITFHEKLGTVHERVERIARLARDLSLTLWDDKASAKKAHDAARLAKADLVTEMVGEFPELQGLMGRYYAQEERLDEEVASAIEEHYKPQGPSDRVPTAPVSIAVALAEKIDTLVGFWTIDEKPTGSKDPYALRRAALGVVRIVLENELRLGFERVISDNYLFHLLRIQRGELVVFFQNTETGSFHSITALFAKERFWRVRGDVDSRYYVCRSNKSTNSTQEVHSEKSIIEASSLDGYEVIQEFPSASFLSDSILAFLADRLKVQLREQGARHDLVDAVFGSGAPSPHANSGVPELAQSQRSKSETSDYDTGEGRVRGDGGALAETGARAPVGDGAAVTPAPDPSPQGGGEKNDDLVLIVRRVEALGRLLETEDGKNLLAGYRRAANILKAEEKKDGAGAFEGAPDAAIPADPAEAALSAALDTAEPAAASALAAEDFAGATAALAKLRAPVDAFFEQVMVNAPEPEVRANRLKLLARLRRATRAVADFDRIAG